MTSSSLVNEELQPTPTPSQPRPVSGLAAVGLVLAVIGIAMTVTSTRDAPAGSGYLDGVTVGEFTQPTGGAVAIRCGAAPFSAVGGRGF